MAKYLVIVESPAKVKTIKKFLGPSYEVMASNGHVRDLPKSALGIDFEHDYEPRYITIRGKGDVLSALRKQVKKAEKIYLATDPDREGEAISWHLYEALKLQDKKVYRITFNEITKTAVKESLKNPREINMDLVNAQQTRRILDRMVGYKISPLLWTKVKRGLSAGRVQSVALRLIGDREDEINAFIPQEYWSLEADFAVKDAKNPLTAKFYGKKDEKLTIGSKEQLDDILKVLEHADYSVADIRKGERLRRQPLPFTTSTLQQEAARMLNFSTSKTMRLAQQLYEGVEIKGQGTVGLISYLRTDSTRVSMEAMQMAEHFISENYGESYLAPKEGRKETKGKIQDAHEAIRPTDINRLPSSLKNDLPRDLFRLYQLIWKRFTASQMAPAVHETVSVRIDAGEYRFTVSAGKLRFDGFLSVYTDKDEEKSSYDRLFDRLTTATELSLRDLRYEKHFTQPPAHFTEASLVHTMEELGIGRPSTYAPTISTILARRYVGKEGKNLFITEIGEIVNNMMKDAFPSIVDVNFTVNMESLLDGIEEDSSNWKVILKNFYPDLEEAVQKAEKELEQVQLVDEETDTECELCGRKMVIKYGPHGKFLGCPGFPECHNTKPYLEKIGVACPKCGKDIVVKRTKRGRRFFGCENYPDCDFTAWQRPTNKKCPKCGDVLVQKGSRLCCSKEGCGYVETAKKQEK